VRYLSQNVPMPRAWLSLPLVLLVLAGCGRRLQQLGGYPKIRPRNEISLSPSTTEILATDGDFNALKGRTSSCDYPAMVRGLPVYANVQPDFEAITKAAPDLVVFDDSLYSPTVIAKIKQVVGENKVFEFHATTIAAFEDQLRQLGAVLSRPIDFSQYIDKIESEREAAKSSAPSTVPKIAVVSGTYIAGTKSFVADVLRLAGGEPSGPDSDRFVPMNPEALLQSNPDMVILATQESTDSNDPKANVAGLLKAANEFASDPRFKALKAVKGNQIYPLDATLVLREGSRVDELISDISQRILHWAKK